MLSNKVKNIIRAPIRNYYSRRIRYRDITIISSNCLAGVIYHDLKLKFLSPTINLTIPNFLEFCEKLDFYLNCEIKEYGVDKTGHPLCIINNEVIIRMVHYRNSREAIESWNKRKERVTRNIFLITTDEFLNSNELKEKFNILPYPKLCFTKIKKNTTGKYLYQSF